MTKSPFQSRLDKWGIPPIKQIIHFVSFKFSDWIIFSEPMNWNLYSSPLVIDNGSEFLKYGFSG
jgi:hypothetical protein